jgi:hypothetical protein
MSRTSTRLLTEPIDQILEKKQSCCVGFQIFEVHGYRFSLSLSAVFIQPIWSADVQLLCVLEMPENVFICCQTYGRFFFPVFIAHCYSSLSALSAFTIALKIDVVPGFTDSPEDQTTRRPVPTQACIHD